MADEENTGPIEEARAFLLLIGWEQKIFPFALQPPERQTDYALDALNKAPWIYHSGFVEALAGYFDGKHDFEVIRRMERVLVVFLVACPEVHMVIPAQEAEDPQKKLVEEFGAEDRTVTQLMEAVQQKSVESAVEEKDGYQRPPEPCPNGKPSRRAG